MHTDLLPFSGSSPASRHSSHQGAIQAAEGREQKRAKLLTFVLDRGRVTDEQIETALMFKRASVCSIRNDLIRDGFIVADGHRKFLRVEGGKVQKKTHTYWRATTDRERQEMLARQQDLMDQFDGVGVA
jgi:transcription initiation factor IIE alpha subunit